MQANVTGPGGVFTIAQMLDSVVETVSARNQLQYDWGTIACRCIGFGDPAYRLAFMYLEYENLASSSATVTAPTYIRGEGVSYYASLLSSGTKDYLRVPIISYPAIGVTPDTLSDTYSTYFTATDGSVGNKLTFFAQTSGVVGVGGKPFNDTVNSKIYGVAVVAAPVPSDATRDLVYARAYFSAADQLVKLPNSQLSVTYDITYP